MAGPGQHEARSGASGKPRHPGLKWKPAAETTFLPASMLPVSEKRARPKAPSTLDEMALYPLRDQQE